MNDYTSKIFDVSNKRVLVIGGSGILGGALACGFHRAGARVAISSTTLEKAQRVCQELSSLSPGILGLQINAQDKASLSEARTCIQEEWGGLDVLVNAAGGNNPKATVMPDGSFFSVDPQAVDEVMKLNFFGGGLLPTQVFGEMMSLQKTPVSVINVSSMSALLPLTRVMAYSASKAAIDNLTRWCAVEFAKKYGRRFRVNAIAPGFFLTEQNRFLLTEKEGGALTSRGQTIISQTPMGEFGKPEELVGAALWLASDASAFVTGVVLPIDGGFSAFSGV